MLRTFWAKLQLAISWIRRHLLFILLGVVGCFTAAAVIRRKTNRVNSIGDAISVQRAKAQVLKLKKEQSAIRVKDAAAAEQVLQLNQKIVEQHKVIAEAASGEPWEKLSDEQIRAALREAGL